jgi:hypothetical protein
VNKGSFQSKNQPKDQKPWWWQFAGLSVLIGSMLGGSSIGVLTNFVPIQSPFAKNAWRSGLLCMTFFPLALLEYKHRRSQLNYRELINITQYLWLILTLFCQVMWAMGLIYASLNIIQSQAYVFNNIHGLFLVLIGVL